MKSQISASSRVSGQYRPGTWRLVPGQVPRGRGPGLTSHQPDTVEFPVMTSDTGYGHVDEFWTPYDSSA
jgi:hypothetical protein